MGKLDARELRQAFGTFITGVTVVTTISDDGLPVGFTANSFTSVSLEPPLLLVCHARSLTSYPCYKTCAHFAVNILAEGQQEISNIFATSKDQRFSQIAWIPDEWGCPIIDGAAASFSCSAYQRTEAGDHDVLIGKVNHFGIADNATGLGYSNSGYFNLGMERRAETLQDSANPVTVGAIIECDGHVLLESTPAGMRPPHAASNRTGSLSAITSKFQSVGLNIQFGPVYSIFDNKKTGEVSTYYRGNAASNTTYGLGQYIAVDQLDAQRYSSNAIGKMMNRYALERQSGIFGLYVGDDSEGDIHMFGEGSGL